MTAFRLCCVCFRRMPANARMTTRCPNRASDALRDMRASVQRRITEGREAANRHGEQTAC